MKLGIKALPIMIVPPLGIILYSLFLSGRPDDPSLSRRTNALRQATLGVTEVRVRTGGLCHRNKSVEKVLFKIQGQKAIELIGNIHISDGQQSSCMCCGGPTFEIYKGNKLLVSLSGQHGQRLRSTQGPWQGDADIAKSTQNDLHNVLKAHKVNWE